MLIEEGTIVINKIELLILQSMTQSKIDFDRTSAIDFMLMVENYITSQRNFVSKSIDNSSIVLSDEVIDDVTTDEKKFVNGSAFKVMMDYHENFQLKKNTIVNRTATFTVKLQEPSTQQPSSV